MTRWLTRSRPSSAATPFSPAAWADAACPRPAGEGSAAVPLLQHRAGLRLEPESSGDLQPGDVRRGRRTRFGRPRTRACASGCRLSSTRWKRPTNILAQSLRRLLAGSEEAGVPVLVTLDGQNWWQHRPDLWNWWDPNLPGLQPEQRLQCRVDGLESDPGREDLLAQLGHVSSGWRPRRTSPARAWSRRIWQGLRALVPIIVEWQRRLPPSRQWLFGGVKLGWEAGIGYNAYHYPDGNRYYEQWPHDSSHDPTNSPGSRQGPERRGLPVGLRRREERRHQGPAAKSRATTLPRSPSCTWRGCAGWRTNLGCRAKSVFTHQGGNYAPWEKHLPFWPAFNRWSSPGWSFYNGGPREAGPLEAEMKAAGRERWAAAEWWWGGATAADWEDHFRQHALLPRLPVHLRVQLEPGHLGVLT